MKIQTSSSHRQHESGMATIVFIALLTIMLILVTAEMRSLAQLHGEQKLLERQQIKRLTQAATNTVAVAVSELESK
jgi:ABC-type Fe3+ transport system permease subunit